MQRLFLSLTLVSLPSLFFEETGVIILLFLCGFEFLFTVFLSKETFMCVPLRISECRFAFIFLQNVCGPIAGNGDAASHCFFYKTSVDPSLVMGILL
jgi:hypothetical protein